MKLPRFRGPSNIRLSRPPPSSSRIPSGRRRREPSDGGAGCTRPRGSRRSRRGPARAWRSASGRGPLRELLADHDRIHLLPPLDYEDVIGLLRESRLVLTDSGGLQQEAPVFGKPVLVLRRDTERPEAIAAGTAVLVGTDEGRIVREAELLLSDPDEYQRMATRTVASAMDSPQSASRTSSWRSAVVISIRSHAGDGHQVPTSYRTDARPSLGESSSVVRCQNTGACWHRQARVGGSLPAVGSRSTERSGGGPAGGVAPQTPWNGFPAPPGINGNSTRQPPN